MPSAVMTAIAAQWYESGSVTSSRCTGTAPIEPTVPGAFGDSPQPNQVPITNATRSSGVTLAIVHRARQSARDPGTALRLPAAGHVPAQVHGFEAGQEFDLARDVEALKPLDGDRRGRLAVQAHRYPRAAPTGRRAGRARCPATSGRAARYSGGLSSAGSFGPRPQMLWSAPNSQCAPSLLFPLAQARRVESAVMSVTRTSDSLPSCHFEKIRPQIFRRRVALHARVELRVRDQPEAEQHGHPDP